MAFMVRQDLTMCTKHPDRGTKKLDRRLGPCRSLPHPVDDVLPHFEPVTFFMHRLRCIVILFIALLSKRTIRGVLSFDITKKSSRILS